MKPHRGAGLALALVLSLFSTVASAALAQTADTAHPYVVFNETMMPDVSKRVALMGSVAYRVEVISQDLEIGQEPVVTVRQQSGAALPVRYFQDRNVGMSQGGYSFLVIAPATGEYRLDLHGARSMTIVRIERTTDEQRLFDVAARPGRAPFTLGFARVVMGGFEVEHQNSELLSGRAAGVELCLGLSGAVLPLSGCLVNLGMYEHASGATLPLFGTAPQVRIISSRRVNVSLALHAGVGKTQTPFRENQSFLVAGVGVGLSHAFGPAAIELIPGISMVQRSGHGADFTSPARAQDRSFVPRLSLGVVLGQ